MTVFLNKIDPSPIANSEFDPKFFTQWLWVLVDSLNENMASIENDFNLLTAGSYTQTQIIAMSIAGQIGNGVILYDITNNVYVGKQNGSLVKFTTASYP
jgi:hypothetical protein